MQVKEIVEMNGVFKDGYDCRIWYANIGCNAEDPFELCPYDAYAPADWNDREIWINGWLAADDELREVQDA